MLFWRTKEAAKFLNKATPVKGRLGPELRV